MSLFEYLHIVEIGGVVHSVICAAFIHHRYDRRERSRRSKFKFVSNELTIRAFIDREPLGLSPAPVQLADVEIPHAVGAALNAIQLQIHLQPEAVLDRRREHERATELIIQRERNIAPCVVKIADIAPQQARLLAAYATGLRRVVGRVRPRMPNRAAFGLAAAAACFRLGAGSVPPLVAKRRAVRLLAAGTGFLFGTRCRGSLMAERRALRLSADVHVSGLTHVAAFQPWPVKMSSAASATTAAAMTASPLSPFVFHRWGLRRMPARSLTAAVHPLQRVCDSRSLRRRFLHSGSRPCNTDISTYFSPCVSAEFVGYI